MKTVKVKVYLYSELSDEAKEKARQWVLEDGFLYQWENEHLIEDAKTIGLRIRSLDCERYDKEGDFQSTADDCANSILKNHGKDCNTYKSAFRYLDQVKQLGEEPDYDTEERQYNAWAQEKGRLEEEFLGDLLEDYLDNQRKAMEWVASEEYIADHMAANGYTFTKDGKRFG